MSRLRGSGSPVGHGVSVSMSSGNHKRFVSQVYGKCLVVSGTRQFVKEVFYPDQIDL